MVKSGHNTIYLHKVFVYRRSATDWSVFPFHRGSTFISGPILSQLW